MNDESGVSAPRCEEMSVRREIYLRPGRKPILLQVTVTPAAKGCRARVLMPTLPVGCHRRRGAATHMMKVEAMAKFVTGAN